MEKISKYKKEEEVGARGGEAAGGQTIANAVLSRIRSGEARMKPRWHFVLKAALSIVGIIILVFSVLYLTSFVLFVLRQTGTIFLPSFGFRGFGLLLFSLPKLLILALAIFVILLEILVKHYSFAYRKPLLYSMLGVLLLVLLGGFAIHKVGVQRRLFIMSENTRVPFMESVYRGYISDGLREVRPGTITAITESGIIMRDRAGREFGVVITPETRLPRGFDFQEGDEIVVFGESSTGTVRAYGVRRIDSGSRPPPSPDLRKPMIFFKKI